MATGYQGTFVISWDQTEIDGLCSPPMDAMVTGACWIWRGRAVRVDGPQDILVLKEANGARELQARASRSVQRMLAGSVLNAPTFDCPDEDEKYRQKFAVTDGRRKYSVTIIDLPEAEQILLMFLGDQPPPDTELWIISKDRSLPHPIRRSALSQNIICFTAGTQIRTDNGQKLVEDLTEGDRIQTRDDGLQPVLWVGSRRLSSARLFVMPSLRPVRIRSGALAEGEPEGDLIVSPQHRVLLRGPAAQALFNQPEILVSAADLVNDRSVQVDRSLREVTYHHLLLNRHQVVWANGVETESFHPAETELSRIEPEQRTRLFEQMPDLRDDPARYGAPARRLLSRAEAAILRHELNPRH